MANASERRKKRRAEERQAQARIDAEIKGTNSDPEVLRDIMKPVDRSTPLEETPDITTDKTVDTPAEAPVEDPAVEEPVVEEPEEEKAQVVLIDPGFVYELPYGGSITWADYESWLLIMEKKSRLRDVQWAFDVMIENVMDRVDIPLEEKADAIASLAVGFRSRVTTMKENQSIIDKVKAVLSGSGDDDLPDSVFAFIEPGGKKDAVGHTVPRTLRHFPVHDEAHVSDALASVSKMLTKGGKAADVARFALPKIVDAGKRMGVIKPVTKSKETESGFQILKGLDGGFRWFGWVTNKWRDRDWKAAPQKGGEILTSESHREFVKWVDGDPAGRMPELWIWHTPGTAYEKQADWIDFADGFLVSGGPLTEKEASGLLALEVLYELGMSHGMEVLERDTKEGLITKYRSFEFSPLPRDKAANLWTSFSTIVKEVAEMGFTDEKRTALVAALGETEVAALESNTEGMAKALMELGVDNKALDTKVVEKPATEKPDAKGAEEDSKELDSTEIAKALAKELNIDGLSSFLKQITVRLDTLEGKQTEDDAQKVADAIAPEAFSTDISKVWDSRPSASDENVVEKKEGEEESGASGDPSAAREAEGEHGWVAEEMGMSQGT